MCRSPTRSGASATPWLCGEPATSSTVSPGFKMLRGPVGRGVFPPDEQLEVVTRATGEVVWDLGVTRTSVDFAAHLAHVAERFADQRRFHWVLDNLNTHWSLDVCQLMARLNGLPFHPRSLSTGLERRAFLTDPEHK